MSGTVWPTPDRSRLLDALGIRVFATDVGPQGTEPPLVLLHDVLGCGHAFARWLEVASPTRRYLVLDLPGCGESDRPDPSRAEDYRIEWIARTLAAALTSAEVAGFEVLGQGLGALVAMAMATYEPDRVARVIAVGPPRSGGHLGHEMRLAGLPAIGTRAFARAYRRADLERTLRRWRAAPQSLEPLTLDVYWDRLGRAGGVEATCELLQQLERAPEIGERFAAAGVPTLLLWGDRDVIGEADRVQWAEVIAHAQTIVLPGCGHAAVEERPEAVVDALGPGKGAGPAT